MPRAGLSSLGLEVLGPGPGEHPAPPPLVLLHGFTQNRRAWGPVLGTLAAGRTLVLVDLPGHGDSREVAADLPTTAELVVRSVRDAGAERFDLLGYSLGARAALHVAVAHPDSLRALVLLSGTPGIEDPAARASRRERDEAMAEELEGQSDVTDFVEQWLASPLLETLRRGEAEVEARLHNEPAGLASSLRLAGTGAQQPLWERLHSAPAPTLSVSGATDLRFTAISRRMCSLLPHCTITIVPGAGHAVHLEQPGPVGRLVDGWLRSVPGGSPESEAGRGDGARGRGDRPARARGGGREGRARAAGERRAGEAGERGERAERPARSGGSGGGTAAPVEPEE